LWMKFVNRKNHSIGSLPRPRNKNAPFGAFYL
jgi:hypothetical protein